MDVINCIPFILIIIFWIGIYVYFKPEKWDLKNRALNYLGKLKYTENNQNIIALINKKLAKRKQEKLLQDLSDSLAYIKNITIIGSGKSISAVALFEQLAEVSPGLSKAFLEMAHFMSVNDKDAAAEVMNKYIDNSYASDIGLFLSDWESIPQEELVSSLDAYRESLRMERNTKLSARNEVVSDLIYMPVVFNCMVVLLNFIYVAYFIEQQDALNMLF